MVRILSRGFGPIFVFTIRIRICCLPFRPLRLPPVSWAGTKTSWGLFSSEWNCRRSAPPWIFSTCSFSRSGVVSTGTVWALGCRRRARSTKCRLCRIAAGKDRLLFFRTRVGGLVDNGHAAGSVAYLGCWVRERPDAFGHDQRHLGRGHDADGLQEHLPRPVVFRLLPAVGPAQDDRVGL